MQELMLHLGDSSPIMPPFLLDLHQNRKESNHELHGHRRIMHSDTGPATYTSC